MEIKQILGGGGGAEVTAQRFNFHDWKEVTAEEWASASGERIAVNAWMDSFPSGSSMGYSVWFHCSPHSSWNATVGHYGTTDVFAGCETAEDVLALDRDKGKWRLRNGVMYYLPQ
jgi:hypothetical protein